MPVNRLTICRHILFTYFQVLLYAPAFAVVFYKRSGVNVTVSLIAWCAVLQVVLGAPFLLHSPISYISKSFEISRVFYYKWTVNFKFLEEETFLSPFLSRSLLLLTLLMWGFTVQRYLRIPAKAFTPVHCVSICFTCNFIGVVFSRTLHYQFYSWYFFSIPALCVFASLPRPKIFNVPIPLFEAAISAAIEYAFNVYPATATSSLVLQAAHVALLLRLCMGGCGEVIPSQVPRKPK
jgi:alpha-1,3-mannosyltransferase